MSNIFLERQADRAERLADQTVDGTLKESLLKAAREYREQARRMALSRKPTHPPG
jgi:hypothetical protein